ncbi:beta-N-acetylhexosaminidase [Deinococcus peraridilitoris]|uniref:Beta-glucosidase-like glycosyl hydrolase n=1 Tax=Deinococcus peraridilitoris (strain DSM 19664 / LMG 22246 / CIP 109416 / KR-200) TaxID=937777 RepID=K9ZYM2_DEIPD|nr:beta-N-acetylhexosaminidase [Deinococcus peraridilitoris]AFZ66748.1 beta-glucosidase-like glycosyl hydrolase [Deinococcus peraridilitoris DSM 19664]
MTLSPDPAVNRCVIVDLPAPDLDARWREHLQRHGFGGVCLFRRNIENRAQLLTLVRDIREVLGQDALIGIDQEGGAVLRVLETPQVPAPMALGAANDPELAREIGAVTARGLIELGINWNFAPVLDINNNPDNPVIGERSFGADPQLVARLGLAWAQGLESAGVMSSVKHFPGHGDTSVDSHLALPVVNKTREVLEAVEWLPFQAAARAGVGSFMTAHILYPALDAELPATLSPRILTDLLRGEWGYDGVVVTDSTDMLAIAERFPNGEGAPLSLIAGADAVLACTHGDLAAQERQVAALSRAVQDGRLTRARVQEATRRLNAAARRFPTTPRPQDSAQRQHDEATCEYAALKAVTSYGNVTLPNGTDRVLLIAPSGAAVGGPYEDALCGSELTRQLQRAFPKLLSVLYSPTLDAQQAECFLHTVREAAADFVLLASSSRWAFTSAEQRLIDGVLALPGPVLHLALWNPYHVTAVDAPALITYGFRSNTLQAVRAVLQGAPALGRLPIDFGERRPFPER